MSDHEQLQQLMDAAIKGCEMDIETSTRLKERIKQIKGMQLSNGDMMHVSEMLDPFDSGGGGDFFSPGCVLNELDGIPYDVMEIGWKGREK